MSHFAKRILKQSTAIKPAILKQADSTHTKMPEEALQELGAVHFPLHRPIATKQYDKTKTPTKEIKDSCLTWITIPKVKDCLLQFKSKKTAGPDGLKPIIFKYMPDKYFGMLELFYKAMIHTAYSPLK